MGSTIELHPGWRFSPDTSTVTRPLSGLEAVFTHLNDNLFNQNCPFIGASISVDSSTSKSGFSTATLQQRAERAFQQTRWSYPMVACKVIGSKDIVYNIENAEGVEAWSKRTVRVVKENGGWLPLREKLSREALMPSAEGDFCAVYVIYSPGQEAADLKSIDVLIHFNHALVDGSGIRTILNEFLTQLADSDRVRPKWGAEISRLYAASIDLTTEEERRAVPEVIPESEINKDVASMINVGVTELHLPKQFVLMSSMEKPDKGLPLYRPDILIPKRENKGTSLVSHTFNEADFLPNLLQTCRSHGSTLTPVLLSALFQATYEFADEKPDSNSSYAVLTAIDLRGGNRMMEPYGQRNQYVFNSVTREIMDVQVSHLEKAAAKGTGFWDLADSVAVQFDQLRQKKGIAGMQDKVSGMIAKQLPKLAGKGGPSRPQTSPYYVSDPPGSNQLDGTYKMGGESDAVLELDSYQLSTDQNWAKVSARSHSWRGKLTLCLTFNMVRIPRQEMEKFLARWVEIVGEIAT